MTCGHEDPVWPAQSPTALPGTSVHRGRRGGGVGGGGGGGGESRERGSEGN